MTLKEEMELKKNLEIKKKKLKPDEQLKYEIQVEKHLNTAKEEQRKLKEAKKQIVDLSEKLNIVLDLEKYSGNRCIIKHESHSKSGNTEATGFLVASDWHLEEQVNPETVTNKNEFNIEIAEKRASNFFTRGLRLLEIQRNGVKIDNLILPLLGDFITSWIHEENMSTTLLTPVEAIAKAQEMLASGIEYLIKNGNFKSIKIPCCVGNHTRITHLPFNSLVTNTSLEYLLYHSLAKEFKSQKNIEFFIPNSYFNIINVYNKVLRLSHGSNILWSGGVGGPTISLNKAIANYNTLQTVDYDILAHLHTYFNGGNFIINGSLIGYNGFSIRIKARYEVPSQAFFLMDNKRGITINSKIFIADSTEKYNKDNT